VRKEDMIYCRYNHTLINIKKLIHVSLYIKNGTGKSTTKQATAHGAFNYVIRIKMKCGCTKY